MSAFEVLLPAMGEGIVDATITRWLVSEGQAVMANSDRLLAKLIPMAKSKELAPLVLVDNEKVSTAWFAHANENTVLLLDHACCVS